MMRFTILFPVTVFFLTLFPFSPGSVLRAENAGEVVQTARLAEGVYRLFVDNRVATVAIITEEGNILIDAAYERTAEALRQALSDLSDKPLLYLINTHLHRDHTGGNAFFGKEAAIIAHPGVRDFLGRERRQGDNIIAALPQHALPGITTDTEMHLHLGGHLLQIRHLPGGHTATDLIVYLPASHILIAGDLLFADNFPFVDIQNGGHPLRFMQHLEWIIREFPDNTTLVGGHGPVYSMSDFKDYYKRLNQSLEAVRTAKAEGLSPDEMKERKILQEWADMGAFFITEERWIDTLYPYL